MRLWIPKRWSLRKRRPSVAPIVMPAARAAPAGAMLPLQGRVQPTPAEWRLYDALRQSVPVVDAAITKIVRLTGGFRLQGRSEEAQALLDQFAAAVPVNAAGHSLQLFADQMLDSLLTYGCAVGELLVDADTGMVQGLLTAHPETVLVEREGLCGCRFSLRGMDGQVGNRLPHPERILFTALNPPPGAVYGVSVLRGLPALSRVLLRIYECIGQNYDRAGNVRYAVTYRPGNDPSAMAFATEHAAEIASAWREGMQAAQAGEVQDFVTVGDVDIRVIGSENQLLDTNVPVRQLLEQLVAKLSIPPFLLGLSWSSTERMSAQQADILTSELEAFRRVLTPMLQTIGAAVLHTAGFAETPEVVWENVNLQDERELAEARLKHAQATEIELRNAETARKLPSEREGIECLMQ